MKALWTPLAIAMLAFAPATAHAQEQVGERVAAVVNDHPISTFDVRQRMMLILITQGGGEIPEAAMAQFQNQALRELIEERLKLQEAAQFDLIIPEGEIDSELAQIAASANSTIPALVRDLNSAGIDVSTLRERIRAERAWEELVRGRFGSRVNVTEDEVDDMMDDMMEQVQQPQFLLSEICLPLERPSDEEQMFNIGLQMIDQMRQGVPFRAIAQQVSACPSAARGGDLGWMMASDLDGDLAQIVPILGQGNVSRPVVVDGMMRLIAVRQRREAAQAGEPGYEVAYAGAPTTLDRETAEEALGRLGETNPCNDNALSTDLGRDIGITLLPMLPERRFETVFHDVLANMDVGQTSEVVEFNGAYHSFYLCEKDEGFGLPPRRAVENQLEADELSLLSRRYLRDVERNSAVEMRMSSGDGSQ